MKKINFKGVEIYVEYKFHEGEPQVLNYGDGSGHPGSGDDVEILKLEIGGQDVTDLLDYYHDEIEEIIMKDHS